MTDAARLTVEQIDVIYEATNRSSGLLSCHPKDWETLCAMAKREAGRLGENKHRCELGFTLATAKNLVSAFGGEDAEVTVFWLPEGAVDNDDGEPPEYKSPAGLYIVFTDCPEEGVIGLEPSVQPPALRPDEAQGVAGVIECPTCKGRWPLAAAIPPADSAEGLVAELMNMETYLRKHADYPGCWIHADNVKKAIDQLAALSGERDAAKLAADKAAAALADADARTDNHRVRLVALTKWLNLCSKERSSNLDRAEAAERARDTAKKDAEGWKHQADMYANAWQRELCAFDGTIYGKTHHIDAMVKTTRIFIADWKKDKAELKRLSDIALHKAAQEFMSGDAAISTVNERGEG